MLAALERNVPVVISDTPRVAGVPFVTVDDRAGARSAAAHLAALGHRDAGVIAFRLRADEHEGAVDAERRHQATYRVTRERLEGYAEGLEQAGIAWDEVPISETFPNSRAAGARAARALLALEPRPTALLAMSDELAFGALEAAAELGLAIPGELSIVGYDDVPAAEAATPPLTTVRQPLAEKGRVAGRMLLEALDGGSPADVTLPTELVVRRSTGVPVRR